MNDPRRAVLLYGALRPGASADEHDTLVQVRSIDGALRRLGFSTDTVVLDRDTAPAAARLRELAPCVVFNLVESIDGDARLAERGAGVCEELRVPFTGAGFAALHATASKPSSKRRLAEAGVPTPAWWDDTVRLRSHPGPWIVKSAWEHASIGIDDESVAGDAARVDELMAQRAREYGGEWFAEAYVEGREFNLALLAGADGGLEVLPPAEIVFADFPAGKPRIVGYAAKWDPASFDYHATPRRLAFAANDRPLLARLGQIARACWQLFGLQGYARVDFRVDRAGRPWVLEVNANPCLSPDAGFAAAAQTAGIGYDALVARLVADALGRHGAHRCSASVAS